MTKLTGSKPHQVSVVEEISNVAKIIKSAAKEFSERASWVDPSLLLEKFEPAESHVLQINEDLEWLYKKLKKAQKHKLSPEVAKFERKLIKRVMELNAYAATFGAARARFNGLTWDLDEFNIGNDARAIRLAKRKWKILEKTTLKR
jgi:hypothetical protein